MLRSSGLLDIRHTCTFLAMHVAVALVARTRTVAASMAELKQLADSESAALSVLQGKLTAARGAKGAAGTTITALQQSIADQQAKIASLAAQHEEVRLTHDAMDALVMQVQADVLANRYRDEEPAVRADVLEAFTSWIMADPARYVSNSSLKYYGWMISDQDSAYVRLVCLRALAGLYRLEGGAYAARLQEFAARFRDRLKAMLRDPSPDVAAAAVVVLHEARLVDHVSVHIVTSILDCLLCPALGTRRVVADYLAATLAHLRPPSHDSDDSADAGGEGEAEGGAGAGDSAGAASSGKGGRAAADGAC